MSRFQSLLLTLVCVGFSSSLYAVDGVVLIDQNRALAGNVTPGDAAGFPITISVSGSYRLSGNLTVPDRFTTAIEITADNVTIDLNGFSISGPTVCTHSSAGVTCVNHGNGHGVTGNHDGLTVVNGTIRGMGAAGVFLGGSDIHIERVRAVSNGNEGIRIQGTGIVSGSSATLNRFTGIFTFSATVTGNFAESNGDRGIFVAQCPSAVIGNTAIFNSGQNIETSGSNCTVAHNAQ